MSVESAVYRLLVERSEYSPIDLLKAEGQLTEALYRAWRTGGLASLDAAFDDLAGTKALLRSAASFAEALGLLAEPVDHRDPDGPADRPLTTSTDPSLKDLLDHRYRRPDDAQPDLFLDSAATASVNALLDALAQGDAKLARDTLTEVRSSAPEYPYLVQAESLIHALETPAPQSEADALKVLGRLENTWAPAALQCLGAPRDHVFLAPLWQNIGRALNPERFDPQRPDRHASHAFEQARDPRLVRQSVLAVPDFRQQPVLLARLAAAEFRLGNRTEALRAWFAMCLLSPDGFAGRVESSSFEDLGVVGAWQSAVLEQDDEEEWSAEWFPAWMLVHEPGLSRALSDMPGKSGPERAFNLLRRLLHRSPDLHGTVDPGSVALRGELQAIHPGLLRSYLRQRADTALHGTP